MFPMLAIDISDVQTISMCVSAFLMLLLYLAIKIVKYFSLGLIT